MTPSNSSPNGAPGGPAQFNGHPSETHTVLLNQLDQPDKRALLSRIWLGPGVGTHKVKEVTPLGMDHSPCPDRIKPKPGIGEEDLKALQKRTLTNLYNLRPAWLTMVHRQLDAAVATAYGWADYTPATPDEEILKRLLALNLERANSAAGQDTKK